MADDENELRREAILVAWEINAGQTQINLH
jgi:hypothetical protein